MTVKELQNEILRIKKEKDVCILAHAYQSHEIWEVADYVGDSYGLSLKAKETKNKNVIMCGVRFMAETCKILSPDKKVYLPNSDAGCPMAEQFTKEDALQLKKQYPGLPLVAYINTSAELKTVTEVVVTSSSAVKIIQNMDEQEMLFVPDCNLGSWISQKLPDKKLHMIKGGCPTHMRITGHDVEEAKAIHPDALVLVHPECLPEVTAMSDYIGSTTDIMKFAKESDAKEFIIGTENSIKEHLQFECPEKMFYPLSKTTVCMNMKLTTLMDVYNTLMLRSGEEIILDPTTIYDARKCIDNMIKLGG